MRVLVGTEILRKVWAHVFVTTREPRKVVRSIQKIRGIVKADALFGTPDVTALVEGGDIATMDEVIDKLALVPKVQGTDSKVADEYNKAQALAMDRGLTQGVRSVDRHN